MAFINATPHELNVIKEDGTTLTIPTCGAVIRVEATREVYEIVDGVECHSVEYGDIVDLDKLPSLTDEDIVIVSGLALSALKDAGEVYLYDFGFASPGELVRGEDGQPLRCRGLTI